MTLLQHMILFWSRFSPLEERLLDEFRKVLSENALQIFDAQISAITKVHRFQTWTEIIFYRKKGFKVDWSGIPRFQCTDEMVLAECIFRVGGKRFKAKLNCVEGLSVIIGIQPSGQAIAFSTWDDDPTVVLIDDPMRQSTGHRNPAIFLPVWNEFLKNHAKDTFSEWTIHDATSTHSVSMDEGEFLILAERENDEYVLQRIEPPSEHLYYLGSHDGRPEPLSKNLELVFKDEGQQSSAP